MLFPRPGERKTDEAFALAGSITLFGKVLHRRYSIVTFKMLRHVALVEEADFRGNLRDRYSPKKHA